MAYRLVATETVFEGKVFQVRIDQLEHPTGRTSRFDVVVHGGAVAIVPLDAQGRIVFIRQYRHPAGERLLEIPAGTLEKGEDHEACAVRECREEIGLSPGRLTHLGSSFLAPGYSTELIHFYLAQDLTPAPLPGDADEDLLPETLPLDEVLSLLLVNKLKDAKTVVGLTFALSHLGRLVSANADPTG